VEGLKRVHPGTRLIGPAANRRHPGNANVFLPGIDADDLLERLQPMVAASTGSACASGNPEASHVLKAMGVSDNDARCCVRFSLGRFTTLEEVERAVAAVRDALGQG